MYNGVDSSHKRQYVRYELGVLLLLVLGGAWIWFHTGMSDTPVSATPSTATTPVLDTNPISFEVVTTEADKEKGLGGRTNVPPDYAMLFVFTIDGRYGFWMKDTLVPIDIIWLSDTGTIIHLEQSVQPSTYPHVFYPETPARYVIETRAGQAQARGWSVGSHVQLPLPYGK